MEQVTHDKVKAACEAALDLVVKALSEAGLTVTLEKVGTPYKSRADFYIKAIGGVNVPFSGGIDIDGEYDKWRRMTGKAVITVKGVGYGTRKCTNTRRFTVRKCGTYNLPGIVAATKENLAALTRQDRDAAAAKDARSKGQAVLDDLQARIPEAFEYEAKARISAHDPTERPVVTVSGLTPDQVVAVVKFVNAL